MVVRYSYISKLERLFKNDSYYLCWIEYLLNKRAKNISIIKNISSVGLVHFFRYFFWIFLYFNKKVNILVYIKYYKYLLNYLYILKFFNVNGVRYFSIMQTKNAKLLKKNKKLQRKLINFLVFYKKVKILFFFKQNNFKVDFFFNSLSKHNMFIYDINLLNSSCVYFFFYLNFFNF